jgi:hypothetical protein
MPPEDDKKQSAATNLVEVRVLADHKEGDKTYKVNAVETIDAKKALELKRAGIVDDDADAVAYAKQVQAEEDRKKNGGAIS